MLDRLLHRSVVFNIDGESYRMRTHRARAEKLTKEVRPNSKTYSHDSPHLRRAPGNFDDREWGASVIGVSSLELWPIDFDSTRRWYAEDLAAIEGRIVDRSRKTALTRCHTGS